MRITQTSLLNWMSNMFDCDYQCIYESTKTRIYQDARFSIVMTKEKAKFDYYKYALEHKYKHIPSINDMVEDNLNGIYIIKRENLFPITSHRKLTRIEIAKQAMRDRVFIDDLIVREPLDFYYKHNFEFDFSPHCFMETKNKKIVVSDLFM